jgi:SSS family transporter
MPLSFWDWAIIIGLLLIYLFIGLWTSRKAGENTQEFFLGGRNMPWWLLGISMVATTFSSDTPNLVTDLVRQDGVAGNWAWWAFLLTGMLTVFVYARLWRRSGISTDLEFYELRYSGRAATLLRGFRAIYLGLLFNVFIIATVTLAMTKIAGALLNFDPVTTVIVVSAITLAYSALGGIRSVILTDFLQFTIAIIGAVWAAVYLLNIPEVGGLENMLNHVEVKDKLSLLPDFDNTDALITLLIVPLAVQWWSVWYPGAEPGGGGYIAQRMLAAKNPDHALKATLLFNVAHYALRPWPWILVALASIIVFPDLASLAEAFPNLPDSMIRNDLAYPAMLALLPVGLLGIVAASLISAFMSTVSTHLNWGSSYIVLDFYQRLIKPGAKQKELVLIGRMSTVVLMVLSGLLALVLESAKQAFELLLQIGAGTGLLFIMRWFWWRINAWSEITAMLVSFGVALYFELIHVSIGFEMPAAYIKLITGVSITTIAWVLVTMLTQAADQKTLIRFVQLINPGGPGWKAFKTYVPNEKQGSWKLPNQLLAMFLGSVMVYAGLFSVGNFIYGKTLLGVGLFLLLMICVFGLRKIWHRL